MRDGYLRGALPRSATPRQLGVLAAFVAVGGSVSAAARLVGIQPSTAKRHLADLRARSGLSTEQLIYAGRAEGWLVVASLEPRQLAAHLLRHRTSLAGHRRVARSITRDRTSDPNDRECYRRDEETDAVDGVGREVP
jgi:DNA-binding MarR family transcriptional regulator